MYTPYLKCIMSDAPRIPNKQKRKNKVKRVKQEMDKAIGDMAKLSIRKREQTIINGQRGYQSAQIYANGPIRAIGRAPSEPTLMSRKLSSMRGARDLLGALNALRSLGCTPEGALWLMQTLNPFSDWKADSVGYPDEDGSRSVVFRVPLQIPITAASNGAIGSGQFDVNFFFLPSLTAGAGTNIMQNFDYQPNTGVLSQSIAGTWPTFNFGFFNAVIVPAGQSTAPHTTSSPLVLDNAVVLNLGLDSFIKGNGRIVSWGLEVYNNTPAIAIGGNVTTYRQTQSHELSTSFTVINPPSGGPTYSDTAPQLSRIMNLWPSSSSQALLLNNSKQWNASEGAYVIGTMSASENPYSQRTNMKLIYLASSNPGATSVPALAQTPQTVSPVSGSPLFLYDGNYLGPVDTNGAYFFNLPNATVLTAIVTAFVEVSPLTTDTTVTLAKSCTPFDPVALELLARVQQTLAVGDIVANNAGGEWFRKICAVLAEVAEPIGNAIGCFIPGAAMAGSLISKGAKLGTQMKFSA